MLKRIFILLILPLYFTAQVQWNKKELNGLQLFYTDPDKHLVSDFETYLSKGKKTVSDYFKIPFKQKISVYIFPDRKSLDKQWQSAWGDTSFHSQCWMVASGVAQRMDVVSPRIWKEEACEHNENDKDEIQKIITHELTHCFHGQYNPSPDFSSAENMDWFIEGLATYVSGQFDESRIRQIKEVAAQNKLPSFLKQFWKGKAKYAIAGSLVKYIDVTYGEKSIIQLLQCTKTRQALDLLKVTETELVEKWKKYVGGL